MPAGSVGLRHAECSIDKADDGFVVTALVAGGPRLSGDVHGVFELPGADAWIRSRGTTVSESGVTTMGEIRPGRAPRVLSGSFTAQAPRCWLLAARSNLQAARNRALARPGAERGVSASPGGVLRPSNATSP